MMTGAFQTSREIFENPIWKNIVDFRLFFLIYGQAVFAEEGYRVSEDLFLERGQWCRSIRKLQEDLTYVENRQIKTYSTSVISRCIARLVQSQRICTKTHELGTVFTVVNYEQYQGFANYKKDNLERNLEQSGNSSGTVGEQSGNNNKNVKNDNKKNTRPKPQKTVYDEQSIPYRLANYLLTKILTFKPDLSRPNLQTWADDMRKLIELNKREPKEIGKVIDWVTNDDFWKVNILCPSKLRGKWDTITARMNSQGERKYRHTEKIVAISDFQPTEEDRKHAAEMARRQGLSAANNE